MEPVPIRSKQISMRLAAALLGMSGLGAVLWITTSPAYHWWSSPEIGHSGRHARIRIPRGWEVQLPLDSGIRGHEGIQCSYRINLVDRRPRFLWWLFKPSRDQWSGMTVNTQESRTKRSAY